MAIKINSWRPGTCGCVLHYSFDDSVPAEEVVYTHLSQNGYGEPTVKCQTHEGIENLTDLYDAVKQLNISMQPPPEE